MDNPRVDALGSKRWYNENDQLHRENGPAVEYYDKSKYWCINDKFHREDGSAIEYPDGYKSWYYYGKWIECSSQEEFERIIKLRMFW